MKKLTFYLRCNKAIIAMVLFFSAYSYSMAQTQNCSGLRTYSVISDLTYATNLSLINNQNGTFFTDVVSPKLDIYMPNILPGDPTNITFPVAILCPGALQNKNGVYSKMAPLLAQRGVVVVSMNPRSIYEPGLVKLLNSLLPSTPIERKKHSERYYTNMAWIFSM